VFGGREAYNPDEGAACCCFLARWGSEVEKRENRGKGDDWTAAERASAIYTRNCQDRDES
jgi:hypothetical protein